MMKRYQQNQCAKLKEHFREHPYYKLCKTVFNVFQEVCPTIILTPEQLFVDASLTLDSIIQTGDIYAEQCQSLWTEKYNQYREQDGTAADKEDTMTEVAMLFYMVMFGMTAINHSHYRSTLLKTLHDSICKFYGFKQCLDIEQKLQDPVNLHTDEMMFWMAVYILSTHSLTKEFDTLNDEEPKRETGTERKAQIAKETKFTDFIINNAETDKVMSIIRQNIIPSRPKPSALVIIGGIEAGKIQQDVTAPSIEKEFGVKSNSIKPYFTKYKGYKKGQNNYYSEDELKPYKNLFCEE
jgi:hypothetical protein